MDLSNQSGRDALSETRDVLSDLRQFLVMVGNTAHSDARTELKEIEECLGQVVNKINDLGRHVMAQ